MVSINYSSREVNCKIVYYGPGLSGKTTNLQYVHSKVPKKSRGDLISLATETDRTLYFDFLPIDIGSISGLATKFQLYTVPGQVFYNATRKLVLRGVDGIVFVADSQRSKREENIESFNNLRENLKEYGFDINSVPLVLQYNKRDLPDLLAIEEIQTDLNSNNWPYFEAAAVKGHGVFDTLKLITKLVLARATNPEGSKVAESAHVVAPSPVSVAAGDVTGGDVGAVHDPIPLPVSQAPAERVMPTVVPKTVPASTVVDKAAESTDKVKIERQGEQKTHFPAVSAAQQPPPQMQPVDTMPDTAPSMSSSEFADSFEVPRVMAMQKSLKVRKKRKSSFSFFGLFRWFGRKKV